MLDKTKRLLITGGHGFIGGHVARRLHEEGHKIRVTDIVPHSQFNAPVFDDVVIGNLCDSSFCSRLMQDIDVVMHFAATMGGMGTIHARNDFIIYQENHTMTLNVLRASLASSVQLVFYASSACVYPDSLQGPDLDVSLVEDDVWKNSPPHPQGFYGLEKLCSELLFQQCSSSSRIDLRIARFHNVYGPMGSWYGGREKVPAAFLRKALAAKLSGERNTTFEIWGNGKQRRSFCFIDDAVEAVLRLMQSDCSLPVNIGADRAVTVKELADMAVTTAALDPGSVSFTYDLDRPVGVGSRNSNNSFVRSTLEWEPSRSLEDGMRITGEWIEGEIAAATASMDSSERAAFLTGLQTSDLVDLEADAITFAILLPITSHGSASRQDCLVNLDRFARSLADTTADDVSRLGERYQVRIYLAIDEDDSFLWGPEEGTGNVAERTLQARGFPHVSTLRCNRPRGHVCALWRDCAREAYKDKLDYYVLMGDDVVLQDANWMSTVHRTFSRLSDIEDVPHGIGCVSFTDVSFPGMPTFPIIHRKHMDIFHGEVVPGCFTNQDGDPFLFQLYRRWGSSTMIPARIYNTLGGSGSARYEKVHADGWTFQPLDDATRAMEAWLRARALNVQRKLTLDVVIPCYRVDMRYLDAFLALRPSPSCSVMFIIIIDNPLSPHVGDLMQKYGHRPDVRIRMNSANFGASASRNRGLQESAAEWVQFLDDDVTPDEDLLVEAEKAIRANPDAAGLVGNAHFPSADSVFTAAVHLAGVTYFWDIAEKIDKDVPWGVTANLIARRNVADGVLFNLQFPKTGGGEDIDYCRRKRDFSVAQRREPFHAAPRVKVTHPWWNGGRRSYWRFYMWSKGDGGLIKLYPALSYRDVCPNAAECLLLCCLVFVLAGCISPFDVIVARLVLGIGVLLLVSIVISSISLDLFRHVVLHPDRVRNMKTTIAGWKWTAAIIEGAIIRVFSEWGRVVGMVERGEFRLLMMRFDWFCGVYGEGPKREEMMNNQMRVGMAVIIIIFAFLL